jgi:hypothetical protein
LGPLAIGLGAAADFFCAAKAAEGASPRTVEWYQMILVRAVRRFGEARPVDAIPAAELRAWLLELRATLAPESIAGYVRGLKAFGNWCTTEELASAGGFRALRRPKVPRVCRAGVGCGFIAVIVWSPCASIRLASQARAFIAAGPGRALGRDPGPRPGLPVGIGNPDSIMRRGRGTRG